MINLLIIEDDMNDLKKLINTVSNNISNIRLSHLSFTGNEAISLLSSLDIDIILLNLSNLSGLDVLTYIAQNNLDQYLNSIVLITSDPSLLAKAPNNVYSYIYTIMNEPIVYPELIHMLSRISDHKILLQDEKQVRDKINKELQLLKFNFSYTGTRYLSDAIVELYNTRDNFRDNFKRDIFPALAKKYKKSENTIFGDIKQAINAMYFDCDEKTIMAYFGYTYAVKPKPKEICFTILNKLL